MRQIIIGLLLFCSAFVVAQNNIKKTAGINYTDGTPTFTPNESSASEFAIDTVTGFLWQWHRTAGPSNLGGWRVLGQGIDVRVDNVPPSYAPFRNQSRFVINGDNELYFNTTGTTWECLNCASTGTTNLSWTEVSATLYRLNSSTGDDVHIKEGSGVTAALSGDTLTLTASGGGSGTVFTDATLDGDGSGGDPLTIAQQSASSSEVLIWTGATWEPSWGNPFTFVTSGATITTAVNEVLIGTVAGDVVMGLPTCDATTDGKHFKFVRNGTDAFSVTIDPGGSQTFYDGTDKKISYGKLSIDCTCRFSGGTGVWFFDNF